MNLKNYKCTIVISRNTNIWQRCQNLLVTNVTSYRYIIISQRICAMYYNSYSYNKIRYKKNSM